jgi:ABC-2 type transport system permease protein
MNINKLKINKYIKTAQTAFQGKTNGGIVYMFPQIILKVIYLVPLMFIWRIITAGGVEVEMTLIQLLSYTYVNALLADILIVSTYMTDWDFDSKCTALFTRPMSVFGQVISRTVGEWVPALLMFSLPMALIAPLIGIQILPQTLWVIPSLILCASLGFAFEFFFFCVTVRVRNVSWLTEVIRSAVVSLFSGTVIPFKILPFGLDRWIIYQPFAALGGAPLSLYIGTAEPARIIPIQIFWNIVFWSITIVWFKKSKERMVSFGG